MIVLYLKENNQFLQGIKDFPEVEERDNKLYLNGNVIVNDLTKVGYREYPEQLLDDIVGFDDEGLPSDEHKTLEQLNLRDFTAEELEDRQLLSMDVRMEIKNIKDRLTTIEIKPIRSK